MCFQCNEEIGIRIGWYEIPPNVRARIFQEHPGRHPIPYVKLSPGGNRNSLGFFEEEELADIKLEFGWYSDCSRVVSRHSPRPMANYVTIIGNAHWIMRPYIREYMGFVDKVRWYQESIREGTPLQQSYCKVEFATNSWEYGTVTARLNPSGAPDIQVDFRNRKELFNILQSTLDKAVSMKDGEAYTGR